MLLRTPISVMRSWIEISRVLKSPMPPTISEMEAMAMRVMFHFSMKPLISSVMVSIIWPISRKPKLGYIRWRASSSWRAWFFMAENSRSERACR